MFSEKIVNRYRNENGVYFVDIRLNDLRQLFDWRDPSPFRERDLDDVAVEYILGCLKELPKSSKVVLSIQVPEATLLKLKEEELSRVVKSYFTYQLELLVKDFRSILKRGVYSLGIGLLFLGTCVALSIFLPPYLESQVLKTFTTEGLIVVGWVAMWRPADVFLYSWWPLVPRLHLLKRALEVRTELIFLKS